MMTGFSLLFLLRSFAGLTLPHLAPVALGLASEAELEKRRLQMASFFPGLRQF